MANNSKYNLLLGIGATVDSLAYEIVVDCNHKALSRRERKIDETLNFQRSRLIPNLSQETTLLDRLSKTLIHHKTSMRTMSISSKMN